MFLFILESIGTSELLLIGVVSLIFLGPRRMPEMAKKIGKFMAEFRGTANEFKETWRREVDLENATREFDLSNIETEVQAGPVTPQQTGSNAPAAAEIRELPPDQIEPLRAAAEKIASSTATAVANDKRNWL